RRWRRDTKHLREAGGHHVRWLILEDRRGPLERPRDEAAADQLTREAEAELRTGEKRESDAHDRGPVVLRADPVLGEGDHLGAILGGCVDRHDGVLRLVVRGERGAMYPSAERFDERSIVRDDERGMVPVGVRLVRAGVAQLLADLDEPREELAAVREDEIARTWVGRPLAGRHVLEARHAASVTGTPPARPARMAKLRAFTVAGEARKVSASRSRPHKPPAKELSRRKAAALSSGGGKLPPRIREEL